MAMGLVGPEEAAVDQGQTPHDDVERRLVQRPHVTIRLRIALVFAVCTLFIAILTVGSTVMLSRFRVKLQFLEAGDECAFEIQEARRFEKNFFLYGTSLYDALEHASKARELLEANEDDVASVIGGAAAQRLMSSLGQYESLLEELAHATERGAEGLSDPELHETENRLRRLGTALLTQASTMIAKERQAMDAMVRTASTAAVISFGVMALMMIVLAHQLTGQVIRPIGRFVRYVQRIAEGDFSPIAPARRYWDEFSTLAVAINRMLDELQARQEQLLQSRKMAAVGSLTSGIAHELNNPLNNISLTVETLLDDFEDTDDVQKKKLLQDIFTQVQRAGATVRNLLDFTRKDQPVFTRIPVREVLEATLRLVGNEMALAKVVAELDVPPDLPPVTGNPRNLEQVFLNLFVNAIQAMPNGGKLGISAAREDDAVRVAVTDTGPGIPEEHLEKIFEPFYTTKEAGEGTGLGLSVSYSIVEKHGGRLEVASEPGQGTTFSVVLPLAPEDA
jgi:signal transduction histidine kinase